MRRLISPRHTWTVISLNFGYTSQISVEISTGKFLSLVTVSTNNLPTDPVVYVVATYGHSKITISLSMHAMNFKSSSVISGKTKGSYNADILHSYSVGVRISAETRVILTNVHHGFPQ
jgi:hypothetical protein